MAVIEGRAHFEITDEVRARIALSDRSDTREVSIGSLAAATCRAFCGPRGLQKGLSPAQADIHRRQHLEMARTIYEEIR